MPAIPMFGNGLIVFGAKFGTELLRPRFQNIHPESNADRQNKTSDENQHDRIEFG
jgi:hypothetical protein